MRRSTAGIMTTASPLSPRRNPSPSRRSSAELRFSSLDRPPSSPDRRRSDPAPGDRELIATAGKPAQVDEQGLSISATMLLGDPSLERSMRA